MTKIVHITYSGNGGAGIAAHRCHEALLRQGLDSNILVLTKPKENDSLSLRYISEYTRIAIKYLLGFLDKHLHFFSEINEIRNIKGDFEIFTTPKSIYKVENHHLVASADIIHLHWISNFINYEAFFNTLQNKKIVWTFHDLNPILGGFHFQHDKDNCPELSAIDARLQYTKNQAYRHLKHDKFHIIYLNNWLKNRCVQSDIFNQYKSSVIPNSIDFSLFRPFEKAESRLSLGINESAKVMLFVCSHPNHKRKGVAILEEALTINLKNKNLTVITIGQHQLKTSSLQTLVNLGVVNCPIVMAKAYSAADIVILPSLEDNLPNVMLEAWACGAPVISSKNGGMIDHIQPGINGELLADNTAEELAKTIGTSFNNIYNRDSIVKYAKEQFSPEVIAGRISKEVYQ